MRSRHVLLILLGAGAIPWGLESVRLPAQYFHTHIGLLTLATGWTFVAAGLSAWAMRPQYRIGALMVAAGYAYFIGGFEFTTNGAVSRVAGSLGGLGTVVLAHVVLSFPTGRLTRWSERIAVAAGYLFVFSTGWINVGLPLPTLKRRLWFGTAFIIVVAIAFLAVRRFVTASRRARRDLLPIPFAAAGLVLFVFLLGGFAIFPSSTQDLLSGKTNSLTRLLSSRGAADLGNAGNIANLLIPIALFLGLLRLRLARAGVGDLVVELERPMAPGELRERLAGILGDPSLELAFVVPDRTGYVDLEGRPFEPDRAPMRRSTPVLDRAGEPLAVLVHDPAVDPDVVQAAAGAARLALENERLQAQVRSQLAEVEASRARILEAADTERRRLERNIHDGAQQRLLTLGLALRRAERHMGADSPKAEAIIAEAAAELDSVLHELRDLARGLHPAILVDEGLGPALLALADRSPIPVEIRVSPKERLPASVETTAYFVVSEALANVARHSGATGASVEALRKGGSLMIRVEDNGRGGADFGGGTGLSGLRDRVEALHGKLVLLSPVDAGTVIVVELPCE